MRLNVVLEPGEDGWFVAEVPALPRCVSQGKTREEAIANAREAIEGWLLVEQDKFRASNDSEIVALAV
jgi:predicted RNase H-like HicB family nuclease